MPRSDPFLLQLLLIFIAAKLFGELFERFKLPAVLGEILAGICFGRFAVGWLNPTPAIESVAQVGAIFLLFGVGLQTEPAELVKVGRKSLGVATGGVLVPFIFGITYFFLNGVVAHEAIFLATAMVATSVGITARVLADLDMLATRPAKIVLAAAVFDDILGMLLLAVVAGVASSKGVQWTQLGLLLAEAAAFALFMIFLAPRIIRRVSPHFERAQTHDAPLVIALIICLALSLAAEKLGMAAIIGAFFAGIAFADYAPQSQLRPRVGAITEFLAPYFFFVMGARLNLRVFSRDLWVDAIVVSLLAVAAKLIGCGLPMLREGWRMALKVGVGMVPRGEVGLIVALIGVNMAMVSDSGYAIVVFMTAVTTLIAPPLLRMLFSRDPQVVVVSSQIPIS